jgi:translation initiation factor 1
VADRRRVKVRREVGGRRGKTVTTVSGVPGSVKDGVIELQSDQREVVLEVLRGAGFDAVLAGG